MQASFIKYKIDNIHTVTYECHKSNVVGHLLRLHATQKALQLPLSSSFLFSTANLDGLNKVTCQVFFMC